jgi:hypothetical protein
LAGDRAVKIWNLKQDREIQTITFSKIVPDAFRGEFRDNPGAYRKHSGMFNINFRRRQMTLKMTPAKAAGLTPETWTLERLLREASRV